MMKKIILCILIFFSFGFLNNSFADTLIEEYKYYNYITNGFNSIYKTTTTYHQVLETSDYIYYIGGKNYSSQRDFYILFYFDKSKKEYKTLLHKYFHPNYTSMPAFAFYNGEIIFVTYSTDCYDCTRDILKYYKITKNTSTGNLEIVPFDISTIDKTSISIHRYKNYYCFNIETNKDACFYKKGDKFYYDLFINSSSQSYITQELYFSDNFSKKVKGYRFSDFIDDNGKRNILFSLSYFDDENKQKFNSYIIANDNNFVLLKKGGFLFGINSQNNSIFGISETEKEIKIYNENLILGGKFFDNSFIFEYLSKDIKLYSINSLFKFEDLNIFLNATKNCNDYEFKEADTEETFFDYTYSSMSGASIIYNDINKPNYGNGFFQYKDFDGNNYSVEFFKADNLTSDFNNFFATGTGSFTFDRIGFSDISIKIKSPEKGLNYLAIAGKGGVDFSIVDCENFKLLPDSYFDRNKEHKKNVLNQIFVFKNKLNEICLRDTGNFFSNTKISSFDYGFIGTKTKMKKVCKYEDGKITIDGEDYNGTLKDLGIDEKEFNNFKDNIPKDKPSNGLFQKYLKKITDNFKGLGDLIKLLNISFIDEPQKYSLKIPLLKLENNNGKLQVGAGTYQANMQKIDDRLGVSNISTDGTSGTKKFISFFLAIFYIIIRVFLVVLAFIPFILFYKITEFLTKSLFGKLLGDGKNSPGVLAYVVLIFFAVPVFIGISKITNSYLDFSGFLINGVNFINTVFGFILSSFFDYGFFQFFVNTFFGLIISSFIGYLAYIIVKK